PGAVLVRRQRGRRRSRAFAFHGRAGRRQGPGRARRIAVAHRRAIRGAGAGAAGAPDGPAEHARLDAGPAADRGAGLSRVRQPAGAGAHLHRRGQGARVARHVVGAGPGVRVRRVAVHAPVCVAARARGAGMNATMKATLWQRVRIKRADRLIAGAVLASVLLAWLVIVGLDTFINFAKEVGDIGHGYSLGQAVAYIALTVPRRVYDWFVFAALIGSLLGLGGLGASGELTALRASGMSKLRICLSAACLVLVLMAGVFVLGETAAPAGEQRAQNIQLTAHSGKLGNTRSGLWAK